MAVIGGRAHINGITFATDTHVVRGTLSKGSLSIKVQPLPCLQIFSAMDKVPFLRGISKLAKLNLKTFLLMILLFAIPWDWLVPWNDSFISESFWSWLGLLGFFFIMVFLLKPLWQFHGAEHKAFNIYTNGKSLSLSTVKAASRVSERCGTHLAVLLMPIVILLSFETIPLYLFVLALSIGYELFYWNSRSKGYLPISRIAELIQNYIVTAEPTEEQLQLAIATLSKAIDYD
ncbi:putative metal-dependent enzyme [Desulfosporosinus orientis DSM 765]|uniref:Putative metal-dependent enzyme n=1 Tax=Desulfosporosinus orientis (strain ATCC 19365 / DSM 765 / NCIMB 8382 / VKM B-1628 / Singapore I) TaxID=768706 RepID=G7WIU1_DESOD|nr:DUF1385 domain-containing protein [Desulfosporosinus orientis]AET69165.1 putative metal-dependent enzyme [Desulfosporosinus orientis DSM 765]